MATCKDCLHYEVCTFHITENENEKCPHFKDKSQYAEVKHGEWQECGQCNHVHYRYRNPDKWKKYKCSECGYGNGRYYKANYCPNCGAKMDGGEGFK